MTTDHEALAREYPVQETHEINTGEEYGHWKVDKLTATFFRLTEIEPAHEDGPLIVYINLIDGGMHIDFDCLDDAVLKEFCRLFELPVPDSYSW